jgi:hypothetical protein
MERASVAIHRREEALYWFFTHAPTLSGATIRCRGLVLPELQELQVPLRIDHATKALSDTRASVGRPVYLSVSEDQIKAKRLQNTLAARRSRRRKLEYEQELENALDAERIDKEMWQTRTLAPEGQLRDESQNWESVGRPERLLVSPEDEVPVGSSLPTPAFPLTERIWRRSALMIFSEREDGAWGCQILNTRRK